MSYWGSSFGRWSPFGRQPFPNPPEVRDSDYAYISEHDIVDPPSAYQPDYYSGSRRPQQDDDEEPDVITLKHRGQIFPLQFPPFSIGENLRVASVRRNAAEKLGVRDPRRIRLLYKGRQLKDDGAYTKEEGLKQNSELMCVVSETTMNGSANSSDEESATEEEMREAERNGGVPLGGSRRPKGKSGKNKKRDNRGEGYYNEEPSRPQPSANLQPKPTPSQSARRPSPSPSPRPFDTALPSSSSQSGPAQAALKKIAELDNKYRSELSGAVEKLLSNPPSDQKTRDYEVLRLTETIERDILIKADGIETDGKEDVRAKRKALVKEMNQVLSRLDAAKKRWTSSS